MVARLSLFLSIFLSIFFISHELFAQSTCANRSNTRDVFFGDLHVHTTLSTDAWVQDTRNTPVDAYRFARGARVGLQPYDKEGKATRFSRITRPLDFAAVTDHAEMLGEQRLCQTPGAKGYYSLPCVLLRHWPQMAFFVVMSRATSGDKRYDFCGKDGSYCRQQASGPWQEIQSAANAANSPCEFTAFIGYEWTGSSKENIHRNIIFRNDAVLDLPISFFEHNTAGPMLAALQKNCRGDCEAISIPHNSNLSDGLMFPNYSEQALSVVETQLREQMEPVAEILQHKGSSECWYEAGADELCAFEQLPYSLFRGNVEMLPKLASRLNLVESYPPTANAGYLRSVLIEGIKYKRNTKINPYHLGFIGSTDTHLGLAGATAEFNFKGHGGAGTSHRKTSATPRLDDYIQYSPGGLAAVWAEENTRESIFEAIQRRETYATSGTHIRLRVFAGFDYTEDICGSATVASVGYTQGVPMGGTLKASDERAPVLMVEALADSGTRNHVGTPLQRVQIIKGWVDSKGQSQNKIYEVAGNANNGAGVNESTCEPYGAGANRLCTVWQDPDFDLNKDAYYYARVLENPSCRWSARACIAHAVNCDADEVPESLQHCCMSEYPKTIQERAISSPIWYEPVE